MMKTQNRIKLASILLLLMSTLIFSLTGCAENEKPVESSFSIEGQSTEESTNYLELDLSVPLLSGFDAADTINNQIVESVSAARAEVEDAASILKAEGSQMKAGLHTGYLYSKSEDLVSLWLMMDNYTGGAHGLYWVEPYTFNTATSEIYSFGDLFREGNASAAYISDKIIQKIQENPDMYFPSSVESVKQYNNEFSFYINGNQLVVYFSLYDIAPYAAGIQFFDFDAEELKDILKPDIYEAMKDASPVDTKGTILDHEK